MKKFTVTGMSCAACQARVEKAVSGVKGVDSCSVNLLTASMNVEGSASDAAVITAVKKAGYGASPANEKNAADVLPENNAVSVLKKRLFTSVIFLVILMYLNMQDKMAMLPSPAFLTDNLLLGDRSHLIGLFFCSKKTGRSMSSPVFVRHKYSVRIRRDLRHRRYLR